jgi:hypothetical protein
MPRIRFNGHPIPGSEGVVKAFSVFEDFSL